MVQPLLLLVVFLIGSSLADDPDPLKKALDKCSLKFPSVDIKVLKEICKGTTHTIDKDTKCLIKCVGVESGYVMDSGIMIASKIKKTLSAVPDQAKADAAIKKCAAVVKPDACDMAFDQWKCMCDIDSEA